MSTNDAPWVEARVMINGQQLTTAQSMTLRVALSTFMMDMQNEGTLGLDQNSEAIRRGYLATGRDIMHLIHEVRGT